MNSLPFQPHIHTHTHTLFEGKMFHESSLERTPLPEETRSPSRGRPRAARSHALLITLPCSLPRALPPHQAAWDRNPSPLRSVSRGICLQLCFPGYLERQLPKNVSLPSRGIGHKFRGEIELEVYCPGRYARETKAECGRDILVGKDSDDERTILGLASAGLGHWMGGNKVEGTKVAEFGISA